MVTRVIVDMNHCASSYSILIMCLIVC